MQGAVRVASVRVFFSLFCLLLQTTTVGQSGFFSPRKSQVPVQGPSSSGRQARRRLINPLSRWRRFKFDAKVWAMTIALC
jgi:hypothetical protein